MTKEAKKAISKFNTACELLAVLVNEHLFDGCRDYYWVGEEVGGLCDFEETDLFTPEEMVLILENEMPYDDYARWRDYNLENKPRINLQSWLRGLRPELIN